jgi:hypothetical protein
MYVYTLYHFLTKKVSHAGFDNLQISIFIETTLCIKIFHYTRVHSAETGGKRKQLQMNCAPIN